MKVNLRISGVLYNILKDHLFPGDGKESVAIALCGRYESTDLTALMVHKVIPIPIEDCIERSNSAIKWKTNKLVDLLEFANKKSLSVLKIHSHPTGYPVFSDTDNDSDKEIFDSLFSWIENVSIHASTVMLPDGEIFGRSIMNGVYFKPLDKITIVGDDIRYFLNSKSQSIEEFNVRTAQAFGVATTTMLKNLTVGVIGCSGTGSPTIEQLARLGFGKIILIDPDKIEKKNLNRIVNSKMTDALTERFKVDVLKEAIEAMGLLTEVEGYSVNLYDDKSVIKKIASCDLLFGCMDSVDGRQLLNQIATFYLIPYFDLGVKLIADGKGNISQIWGTVHYLQPGLSSLLSRGVYTQDDLSAACIHRNDPVTYESLKKEGYIKNVIVESPAVISINMQVSSMALVEFLARIHKFRYDDNSCSAITRLSFTDSYIQKEAETSIDLYLEKFVGRGDIYPLLNMPEFS